MSDRRRGILGTELGLSSFSSRFAISGPRGESRSAGSPSPAGRLVSRGTHRFVFRWARMEMSPNTIITAPINFDEAWEALSPATQVMLAHLHRAAQGPAVHRQSS